MNNITRKKILTEAKKQLNNNFADLKNFQSGEIESKQDEYIEIVCKEMGYELRDFYNADGKLLQKLLSQTFSIN